MAAITKNIISIEGTSGLGKTTFQKKLKANGLKVQEGDFGDLSKKHPVLMNKFEDISLDGAFIAFMAMRWVCGLLDGNEYTDRDYISAILYRMIHLSGTAVDYFRWIYQNQQLRELLDYIKDVKPAQLKRVWLIDTECTKAAERIKQRGWFDKDLGVDYIKKQNYMFRFAATRLGELCLDLQGEYVSDFFAKKLWKGQCETKQHEVLCEKITNDIIGRGTSRYFIPRMSLEVGYKIGEIAIKKRHCNRHDKYEHYCMNCSDQNRMMSPSFRCDGPSTVDMDGNRFFFEKGRWVCGPRCSHVHNVFEI